MPSFFFDQLFTGRAWLDSVRLAVDDDGTIRSVEAEGHASGAERLAGIGVPGVPNVHSHAHQRAMAGLAERSGAGDDSFWTWREVMYRHAGAIGPRDLEAIAAQLYVEMLESGYTAVGEFQYLHHDVDGEPYSEVAEMSLRCLAAASRTGIGITSLPVLYTSSGFGGQAPTADQRRFVSDFDTFSRIVEALDQRRSPQHSVGIAPHSLRAVSSGDLERAVSAFAGRGPIHIHIAEQRREVEDCVAWSGERPLAWLLDHAPVDAKWCLIHVTHLDDDEVGRLIDSGAVAGLCPTTEANLGDGISRAREILDGGGRIAIGSDSHISISPVEEVRWLEYGQRLRGERRACLAGGPDRSTGRRVFESVVSAGAQALGRPIGRLEAGARADIVTLDSEHPLLHGRRRDDVLDAWIFAGNRTLVRDVMVGGRLRVRDGRHVLRDAVATAYRHCLDRLWGNAS